MAYKVTFFFQDSGGYGWSENYYNNGTVLNVATDAHSLADRRINILPEDASLNYIRHQTNTYRDVGFSAYNPNPGQPNGLFPGNGLVDFTSLKTRYEASVGTGRIFLRTVPVQEVTEESFTPSPIFLTLLNAYLDALVAPTLSGANWCVKTSLRGAGPPTRINVFSPAPYLPRGFTFSAPTGQITGLPVIRMHGCRVTGYNGLKQVTAVVVGAPLDTITVGGASPPVAEPLTSNPYVTLEAYAYNPIIYAIVEGVTRRSPGNFFGRRRGRRQSTLPLRL